MGRVMASRVAPAGLALVLALALAPAPPALAWDEQTLGNAQQALDAADQSLFQQLAAASPMFALAQGRSNFQLGQNQVSTYILAGVGSPAPNISFLICSGSTPCNIPGLSIGTTPAIVWQQDGVNPGQLDELQLGTLVASIGSLATAGVSPPYLGAQNYSIPAGYTLGYPVGEGRMQINGSGRGWERQTCVLAVQLFPFPTNPNGCGQGGFYSFPNRVSYSGQDAEAVTFNANGVAPIASGVPITSFTPVTIINSGGINQQVYKVNLASPLSGSQIAAINAIISQPGGPPRLETNNQFAAYVAVEHDSAGRAITTFPLAAGGTIPTVDPSGAFVVADCFARAVPGDPEGPDPTSPVSPAPPTNGNACPLPSDFSYGYSAIPISAQTNTGSPTVVFQSLHAKTFSSDVAAGEIMTASIAGVLPANTKVLSVSGGTTVTMTHNASATMPIGTGIKFNGNNIKAYTTASTTTTTLTVNSTTGVSGGMHVWAYGLQYGTTVSSVTDSTHVVVSQPPLPGGVAMGGSHCIAGFGDTGPGCVTFSATDATGAGLTLTIDTVHLDDAIFAITGNTDSDTITDGQGLEVAITNTSASAPQWGIDPLYDLPLHGGVFITASGQPGSFGIMGTPGSVKRMLVAENTSTLATGETTAIFATTVDTVIESVQPSGDHVIIVNKNGNSATNSVVLDTDGNLALAGNITLSGSELFAVGTTVALLPTCNSGAKGLITRVDDALAPTWNGTLSGTGSVSVLAYCNGSNWTAH